jgi:hypothetical protein
MSMMTKNGRENVQKQKRTWIEDAAESQENKEYTTE